MERLAEVLLQRRGDLQEYGSVAGVVLQKSLIMPFMHPDVIPNPFDIILWNAKMFIKMCTLLFSIEWNKIITISVKNDQTKFDDCFFFCFGLQPMVTKHYRFTNTFIFYLYYLFFKKLILLFSSDALYWSKVTVKIKDLIIFQIKAVLLNILLFKEFRKISCLVQLF